MEFALTLPLILVLGLGVIEVGWALVDQHVVTRLTREGSNLISRDTSLQDASTAMKSMATRPVDFNTNSKLIFSVLKKVGTVGTANYNKEVLYQRYEFGSLSATSKLTTQGAGTFKGPPDYEAVNSNNDPNLRITNMPPGFSIEKGGFVYVTEIYSTHTLITPFDKFGINLPKTLYSIAYF